MTIRYVLVAVAFVALALVTVIGRGSLAAEPKLAATLAGHTDVVYAVAFSPDQKVLASGSQDQTIKLWDVATAKETMALAGHTSWVGGVAFLPDATGLLSLGATGEVKRWDLTLTPALSPGEREKLTAKESKTPFAGHNHLGFALALSPDGKHLATGGIDLVTSTIKLWNPATGMLRLTLEGHTNFVSGLAFSASGKQLASSSQDGTIKIWDVATGKELLTLTGHADRVTGVAFAPDEKTVASTGFDGSVKLWDLTLTPALSQGEKEIVTGKERMALAGHTLSALSIAFHPDGTQLATGSGAVAAVQGEVKLWDIATGKELATIRDQTGSVFSLKYSPDGKLLAVASGDSKVRLWEVGGK